MCAIRQSIAADAVPAAKVKYPHHAMSRRYHDAEIMKSRRERKEACLLIRCQITPRPWFRLALRRRRYRSFQHCSFRRLLPSPLRRHRQPLSKRIWQHTLDCLISIQPATADWWGMLPLTLAS